jgi:acetylornithine deacetylase/succinyl-diaminopimelate desuccinylase
MLSSPDRARIVELLAQLVAFDTANPPGRERPAAEFLVTALRSAGCEATAIDLAPGRTNAVGRIDNGPGPVFAFNSHIDTVPAGEGWSRDPFRLTAADGRLYGRGACDAKGSIAAMTEAVRLLGAERGRWQGTLIAAFVADEETTSIGARGFVSSGIRVDQRTHLEPHHERTQRRAAAGAARRPHHRPFEPAPMRPRSTATSRSASSAAAEAGRASPPAGGPVVPTRRDRPGW